jgi:hypothetical protein
VAPYNCFPQTDGAPAGEADTNGHFDDFVLVDDQNERAPAALALALAPADKCVFPDA